MKSILVHERAMHFLRETVVGSMEGVFFVLISSLFMVAGAAMCVETFGPRGQASGTIVAVPSLPTSASVTDRPPQLRFATIQSDPSSSQ